MSAVAALRERTRYADEAVADVVGDAPPLTRAQADRLASLLRGA